ncbi:MAG: hypothetical protein CVV21_03675 [Candidatus Goldiibacteriota bacterium HGW-Goldbacteria-1]|jgi:hypothetical protein|nr:MAG: hypothetical protein CVV21_03675 [Candidatus Goldiibacteriota bacterium HGW-Goldbacteria-1]
MHPPFGFYFGLIIILYGGIFNKKSSWAAWQLSGWAKTIKTQFCKNDNKAAWRLGKDDKDTVLQK